MSRLFPLFLASLLLLSACRPNQPEASAEPEPAPEALPAGDLLKDFVSDDAMFRIQLNVSHLLDKTGIEGNPTDSTFIEDLIYSLPDEVQAFLEGFEVADGWAQPLVTEADYDLMMLSQGEDGAPATLSANFGQGRIDLVMTHYQAFNSIYTLPDDLRMIRLDRKVGKFSYQVQGDSIITALFDLANKEQNALLTLRELSEQYDDDYDY